jgi:hypothetical protein
MTLQSTLQSDALGQSLENSVSTGLSAPPVIIRLAGLPAHALEPLASPSCFVFMEVLESLEANLAGARHALVDAIRETLPRFDAPARRFLLAVKRSCFNGRDLETYRWRAEWGELLRVSPSLVEHIVSLEEQLRENDQAFTNLYKGEFARERRHILTLLEDRRFLRGIALGRPGLVEKIRARAPSLVASEFLARPEKWEQSLQRFVTRAATKLSANSTLTSYALGSIQAFPNAMGFRFVEALQHEVSLVRINRPELEQFQTLLMRHPAVRERALVMWNDSLEELESGQYRFLRSGHWDLDPGATQFHFARPVKITVRLSNPLLRAAQEALRNGALCYNLLLALLENEDRRTTGTVDPRNRSAIDQLIDLGILIILPPWPVYEVCLEQRIWRFLHALPDEPTLRATTDALGDLLTLEEGFASVLQPESSVVSMRDAFSRLLGTVIQLAGHQNPIVVQAHLFEDVLLENVLESERRIFQIAPSSVQDILRSASLVSRFAGLFNHRHDILHTLAAWWRENEPRRREIPFVEIARMFAPLWRDFLQFDKTANESALNTFDPLQATANGILRERRERLLIQSTELLRKSPTKDLLPEQQLAELLDDLPHRYAPMFGPSVFVQPVDGEGSFWVLNRLYEGTGRYLSRVTPLLKGSLQKRFLDHLTARSVINLEEEEADLLEVKHPWGTLVNAHPPQAAKVLDLRGLYLDLPRERRVGLGDLTIQADLDSETFRLIDSSGRRVLPTHLSTLTDSKLPALLRFLLMFGPGETRGVFPFPHSESNEHFTSFNRLTCGRLILCRRRWTIEIENLRNDLAGATDRRAYAYIHKWLRRLGLPAEGFYYERTYYGGIKPHYVDFTSPTLCRLFVSSLQKKTGSYLRFEEALPSPTDFPLDSSLNRRGFELLIDSLAVRTLSENSFAGVPSHDRESVFLRKE